MSRTPKRHIARIIAIAATVVFTGCSGDYLTNATKDSSEEESAALTAETTSSELPGDTLPLIEDFTIGFSAKNLDESYSKQLARGVDTKARELSAEIIIVSADSDPEKQVADVRALVKDGVDGIVIEPVDSVEAIKAVDIATQAGVLVVAISDRIGDSSELGEKSVFPGTNGFVSTDDRKIGDTAAQIAKRHQPERLEIAILSGPETHDRYQQRLDGFISSLERSTKPFEILETPFTDDTTVGGNESCAEITQRGTNPNIVFAVSDQLAQGCIEAYTAAGVDTADLPAIISVGGSTAAKTMLDDKQIIASICIQPREIGEIASTQLMNTQLTGNLARSAELVDSISVTNTDDLTCPFNW